MTAEVKRLYRSQEDRMIAGVCGGLGEYLSIDATIIRLIFVITALWGGAGLIVYLVMMLVVPEAPSQAEPVKAEPVEPEPAADEGES